MLESVAILHGFFFAKPANAGARNPGVASCSCGRISNAARAFSVQAPVSSIVLNHSLGNHCALLGQEFLCKRHWLFSFSKSSVNIPHGSRGRLRRWRRLQVRAMIDVAIAVDVINDLGTDTLTFLAVTVVVVPTFKILKASPILGFFFAGIVLNQFGLIRNLVDVKVL